MSAAARSSDLSVLVNIPVGSATQTSLTAAPVGRGQECKLCLLLVYFLVNDLAYFSGPFKVYFYTALAVGQAVYMYIPHCSSK